MQLHNAAAFYYWHRKNPKDALRLGIRDLAAARPRYGYRRLHALPRRECWLKQRQAGAALVSAGEPAGTDTLPSAEDRGAATSTATGPDAPTSNGALISSPTSWPANFISPGRRRENSYIESFNGKLRDESLSQSRFLSLYEAQEFLEAWRREYNETRPHSSLAIYRLLRISSNFGRLPEDDRPNLEIVSF